MSVETLRSDVERLWAAGSDGSKDEGREVFARLRAALSAGTVRAASPDPASPTGWAATAWVKQGILLGFRVGDLADASMDHGRWPFFDKDTLPLQRFTIGSGVRIVPGGTSNRDGAYLAFSDHERGMLRPGLLADWTVLSVDPISCEPDALQGARVLATAVGGEVVHEG